MAGDKTKMCVKRVQWASQGTDSAIAALEGGECIDTDDEGPREDNAAYLHRGSCLLYVINVTIDSKSRPKLSSLGDGSHQGQSNQ